MMHYHKASADLYRMLNLRIQWREQVARGELENLGATEAMCAWTVNNDDHV